MGKMSASTDITSIVGTKLSTVCQVTHQDASE
jgi:hypothetical protein